jgi:hypothetical protein
MYLAGVKVGSEAGKGSGVKPSNVISPDLSPFEMVSDPLVKLATPLS